jgi:hypothetical protein
LKYVARVTQVLHSINKIGGLVDGEIRPVADMPLPDRVEIVPEELGASYMMVRYTRSGEFCGDTWHETLQGAFEQAEYEYGLREGSFLRLD